MRRRVLWINIGLGVLLLAIVGAGLAMLAPRPAEQTGRTIEAQRGTVSETVTATGTVETAGSVELAFTTSGVVDQVDVAEGDTVAADDRIAALDDAAQRQALASARSAYVQAVANASTAPLTLAAAQRNLTAAERNQRLNRQTYAESVSAAREALGDAQSSWSESCLTPAGSCPDDTTWAQLRSAEAAIVSARTAYDQAVQNATTTAATNQVKLSQAQVNVDAARSRQTTQCDTFGSTSAACTSAVDALRSAEQAYALQVRANAASDVAGQQSLVTADAAVTEANVALRRLQSSLRSAASDAVRAAQNSLDSALLSQRKGLELDRQAVQSAREAVDQQAAAQQSVDIGAESLTPTQAAVEVAQAGVVAAEAALADTVLTAPINGRIAAIDLTVGDPVAAGTSVVTVLPDAPFQIVAEFSEADALKLATGQPAVVSFDALPGTTATGTVSSIATLPTESVGSAASVTSGGVTTYSATITLDDSPAGAREGMSVSVVVTTQQVDDVVWAPTAAITTEGGRSTVTIRNGEVDTVVEVTTGLAGDSGTEITSGVQEGDLLVIEVGEASTFPGFGGGDGDGFGGRPRDGND